MSFAEMRVDNIAEIHDALRDEGLVPSAEDVPFVVCSTDYRQRFERAVVTITEIFEGTEDE